MTASFTESVVEDAALAWLEALGDVVLHGPDIATGVPVAEQQDYGRLHDTLISKLISDELRVGEAERMTARSA